MKAWWQQLNIREQRLVSALSAVMFIFLFYSFVWQPLNESIEKSTKKLARQEALLTWVISETKRYSLAKGSSRNSSRKGSLSSIVNRTAGAKGIAITRMQPQGENLQVWIDTIAFDTLLAWLAGLSTEEGISVNAIDLSKEEESGQVRVKKLQLGKS